MYERLGLDPHRRHVTRCIGRKREHMRSATGILEAAKERALPGVWARKTYLRGVATAAASSRAHKS